MADSCRMLKHGMWMGALLLAGCGVHEMDPPATPPRAPVTIDPSRIPAVRAPGTGRVALDAVGGPARVEEVIALSAGFEPNSDEGAKAHVTTAPLCIAPCVADLGYGHHVLRYTSLKEGSKDVSFAPLSVKRGTITILRHDLGHYSVYPVQNGLGSFSLVAGIPLMAIGTGLLVVGGSNAGGPYPDAQNLRSTISTAGGVTFGIGAALAVLGIVLKITARDEYQPGSTVQFEEPEPEEAKPTPPKEATPAPAPAAPEPK